MTTKELSEKMVDEKNSFKLYGEYVKKVLESNDWGKTNEWTDYLEITRAILDILHSMDDRELDSIFESLCQKSNFQKEMRPLIERILERTNAYET